MDTNKTGRISELTFERYAEQSGWEPHSSPGGNSNFDYLINRTGKWEKIQVKTASKTAAYNNTGSLEVAISHARSNYRRHYSHDAFDFLAIVHGDLIWLIPIEKIDLSKTHVAPTNPMYIPYILRRPQESKATTEKDQTPPGPQKEMF